MADLVKPELPEFYSPGRTFLSAFAMGAAINARKTQLEAQLQRMQLQAEAMQYREQQQEALFGLKQQQMANQNSLAEQRIENMQGHEQRIVDAAKAKDQADALDTQRRIAMFNDLFSIKAPRGSSEYRQAVDETYHKYTDILGEPESKAVTSQLESQHQRAAAELTKAVSKAQADYQSQVKGLGGNPKLIDYYFNNPNMWKTDGKQSFIDYDKNAQPVPPGDKNRAGSFTIPKSTFDTVMATRKRAYPSASSEIPDVQSLPTPMAPGSKSIPVVSNEGDYNSLPSGSTYVDPKGVTRTKP